LAVKHLLRPDMNVSTFNERYSLFGGIPRHVFMSDSFTDELLKRQDRAIFELTNHQIEMIGRGLVTAVGSFGPGQPKSTLLAIELDSNDNGRFTKERAILVSDAVKDKLYSEGAKRQDESAHGDFDQA
jgi:hypothetical protein